MTLSDLNLPHLAAFAAVAAFVGSYWRTVVTYLKRACDLVIGRVVFKDEAARAVMSAVWGRGRRSPFGLRMFGGLTTYVRPQHRVEVVGFEAVTSEPLLFWFGRVPLLIGSGLGHHNDSSQPNIGHINGNAMPVTMWFIRGTLDADQFIRQAIQDYNDKRQHIEDKDKAIDARRVKRFNVIRMYGVTSDGSSRMEYGGGGTTLKADAPKGGGESKADLLTMLQRGEMRAIRWSAEDLVEQSVEGKPFVHHPVAPEVLSQFDEIDYWIKNEKWFRERGCPWVRGYLIYGPSGSGKSTIVRNLATKHDLPVYTFDLSTYTNQSFTEHWRRVLQDAPAIALIEDIDCCFNGRENLAVKGKQRDGLTFDCLLNTLSGIGSNDGVLLFITTNHIESLDPALGIPRDGNGGAETTRPGRINKAVFVGAMGEPERRALATHILSDDPDLIEATVVSGHGEMAAQFQERCVKLAMERFWARAAHSGLTIGS